MFRAIDNCITLIHTFGFNFIVLPFRHLTYIRITLFINWRQNLDFIQQHVVASTVIQERSDTILLLESKRKNEK